MAKTIEDPTLLTGGPLGGTEVDQSDWPIGEVREFSHAPEGEPPQVMLYRNDPGAHAIFCGIKED